MSIAVVTACHSYWEHLPGWAASVASLTTVPDTVVVATADADRAAAEIGDTLTDVQFVDCGDSMTLADLFNPAIAHADTDWVAWLGVDDRYRPHALDGIERDDADVVAFGMQYGDRVWAPQPTVSGLLRLTDNQVPCGSPMRRSMWEKMPLQARFTPFDDWALWVGFARIGARFASTGRIDFDYRWHASTPTDVSAHRPLIADWLQSL